MIVIITGASKGIGKYLTERFRKEGTVVFGTYNSTSINIDEDIEYYSKVDVSNFDEVETWINSIKNKLKNIVLINCAGISYNAFAHKSDINQWKKVIDINLIGSFNVIRCLLPIMREQKYGRIINFSSVVAKLPTPGISAYATSKAGLIGMTKSLANENGMLGITVNTINLGYVNLGMGVNNVPETYKEKILKQIPLGRFCEADEVYNTIQYLINTQYVNGIDLDINGGLI